MPDIDETTAGPANDATEIVPPVTQAAPELAWSQDATVEIVHPSWRETYGAAAVITGCCLVAALVVGVVGWLLTRPDDVVPLPAGDPTPVLAPAAALPPVTPPPWTPAPGAAPTPYCAPGHNSDRGCLPVVNDPAIERPVKTMDPAPVAAVPAPAPSTVTVTPKAVTPPAPSAADLDERYLAALTAGGLKITDVREVVTGAHAICRFLASGHSEPDAISVAMHNNASLTQPNAQTMIDSAVRVYCPEQAD